MCSHTPYSAQNPGDLVRPDRWPRCLTVPTLATTAHRQHPGPPRRRRGPGAARPGRSRWSAVGGDDPDPVRARGPSSSAALRAQPWVSAPRCKSANRRARRRAARPGAGRCRPRLAARLPGHRERGQGGRRPATDEQSRSRRRAGRRRGANSGPAGWGPPSAGPAGVGARPQPARRGSVAGGPGEQFEEPPHDLVLQVDGCVVAAGDAGGSWSRARVFVRGTPSGWGRRC